MIDRPLLFPDEYPVKIFRSSILPLPWRIFSSVLFSAFLLPLYFFTSLPHLLSVFSRPRKLDNEQDLYDYALRILMRRAHSVHEMKTKLLRRADSELLAQVVLARLKESGQLDDSRYARQFTRTHAEVRKQGKFRIARDLRARGVPDRHINDALTESAETNDEAAVVRQRIERKLRSFRGEISDKKFAS